MASQLVTRRQFHVLLVEDNPFDVFLVRTALQKTQSPPCLHVAVDGEVAVDFMRRAAPYEAMPRPDLILLDLNLPRKGGREVLKEIKADPLLRSIPVVVLTTSSASDDVFGCYDLAGNCFISKPMDVAQFFEVMKTTADFWLQVARLPTEAA